MEKALTLSSHAADDIVQDAAGARSSIALLWA